MDRGHDRGSYVGTAVSEFAEERVGSLHAPLHRGDKEPNATRNGVLFQKICPVFPKMLGFFESSLGECCVEVGCVCG